ncbi:MAG: tRNA pseudouridine(55) synthase TruB [Ignavibacteriales bacterium]|nr:tRNA pseudouridine(55) synthase TruB [Ignavibacteriales bacterium]
MTDPLPRIDRRTPTDKPIDFASGAIVLIDKPLGVTSFRVVARVRRATGVKKVGHAGTLDPLASGLLIVAVGRQATKRVSEFQELPKTYTGEIRFGAKTKTLDAEAEPYDFRPTDDLTLDSIRRAAEGFVGEIEQIPPMFSAVHHKGKKLYTLARKGVEVEREPRRAYVERFEIASYDPPVARFETTGAKGLYVRTLAADLGEALGCGAYLQSLRRAQIGPHRVSDALTLEEFERR